MLLVGEFYTMISAGYVNVGNTLLTFTIGEIKSKIFVLTL